MRRRVVRLVGCLVALAVVAGIAGLAFIYSGIYNMGATYPDNTLVSWAATTTMDHSVRRHSRTVKTPDLGVSEMAPLGAWRYSRTCAGCHGAPGQGIGALGQGLVPAPPKLTETAADWKPNELFWITRNGVRMTGMPSWGASTPDRDIWQIVAFLRRVPNMTPDEYNALVANGANRASGR